MLVLTDKKSARDFGITCRREGRSVALVPTMGFLHDGHLALVKAAKVKADVVIVSIYVNPTQFSANEDFGVYPKALARDHELLKQLAVDAIFQPVNLYASAASSNDADNAMGVSGSGRPQPGDHETFVQVELLQRPLCGKSRPHFFKGVATVVTKLFNIVNPDMAFFGSKDYQQLQVIKRLVQDLDFGIEIIGLPTVRERDGLAMSSRNALLQPAHRAQAPSVYQALQTAQKQALYGGVSRPEEVKQIVGQRLSETEGRVDYIEVVDASSLEAVADIQAQPTVLAVAIFFGTVRLIDNIALYQTPD